MAKMAAAGALIDPVHADDLVPLMRDSRSCRARTRRSDTAWATRSLSCTHSRVAACVASRTTGGAIPASKRLLPARRAQAPLVTGLESVEAELGMRSGEVVADRGGEGQELRRHPGADGVHAEVLGARVAAAVAVEAGEGVVVAGLELVARGRSVPWPI